MNDLKRAEYLDDQDPLKLFSTYFHHTPNEIYLDGNSLGKLPLQAKADIRQAIDSQWGQNLIRSWNDHWL
ncbi:MAG: kynureninase, partial [Candidatus Arcticimaribacter sp.]